MGPGMGGGGVSPYYIKIFSPLQAAIMWMNHTVLLNGNLSGFRFFQMTELLALHLEVHFHFIVFWHALLLIKRVFGYFDFSSLFRQSFVSGCFSYFFHGL
jgi:hypothetical protein